MFELEALADGRLSVASLKSATVEAFVDAAVGRDSTRRCGVEASVESGRDAARTGVLTLSFGFGVGDYTEYEVFAVPLVQNEGDSDCRAASVEMLGRLGDAARDLTRLGISTVNWLNRELDKEASGVVRPP